MEGLHGSALEELWEETQRKYAALLRKELQPTLEYFELINEELMEEIPLKEEDDPNFDYPEGYDWREAATCGYCSRFNNILCIRTYGMGYSDL